jgi:hypothetical protein
LLQAAYNINKVAFFLRPMNARWRQQPTSDGEGKKKMSVFPDFGTVNFEKQAKESL